MPYEHPGEIPETQLPCGHYVHWCEECAQNQHQRDKYLAWCESWERPDVAFAVNHVVLHARDCTAVLGPDKVDPNEHFHFMPGSMPLTKEEANSWLRKSHERRRCLLCVPDIIWPNWVKVGRRWKTEE
jgi:Protein of unknown function (DUF2826)